ncbi:MAG: 16S rRNA (adenine(1518)-N(6)/adenine(1519)-N(6))-dimethyltransferase RsmA [bacterium]|nr:16S rRNA (adenine(1518)-N(6)/adenine(1519)-N(6))-dimethyltransferase RsmA [bacterium]
MTPFDIKTLLARHHLYPKKRLGQNFLVNQKALSQMVEASSLSKDDTVIEVGAGLGVLTQELAKYAGRVIAIEKDESLIPLLQDVLAQYSNIEIIHGDILSASSLPAASYPQLAAGKLRSDYKVVANLPYNITSPVIRKFLEAECRPNLMVLMMQKEVAERIAASPPNMSVLACSVQVYATPNIIARVSKSSFWPQPDVDSSILQITPLPKGIYGELSKEDIPLFFRIMKAGFSSPRRQLLNNLSLGLSRSREDVTQLLETCSIEPKRRAETLSIKDWVCLVKAVQSSTIS